MYVLNCVCPVWSLGVCRCQRISCTATTSIWIVRRYQHCQFTSCEQGRIQTKLQLIVYHTIGRVRLKCDGTRAETRFRLSAKRTSSFKSAGASVQSTAGSRGVRISGSNAGYTVFRGSVKSTDYPLHSPVSLSLPLRFVTVCHHISTGLYVKVCGQCWWLRRVVGIRVYIQEYQ
jgi:hypothetical protein